MNYEVVKNPHLPTGKVCHLITGNALPLAMADKLINEGIELIHPNTLQSVEFALADHADLSVCPVMNGIIFLASSQTDLKEKLISLGLCVIMSNMEPKSPYPGDCLFNFVYNDNISIINSAIHPFFDYTKFISVKQGYIKCSVAPVTENAIITDDPGIARTASETGIDVCFAEKGDIVLKGYPYGFIGGCCGKIDKNVMAFCGDLSLHKSYSTIKSFLLKHNVEIFNLAPDQTLLDIGSLIPITQMKG